MTRHDRTTAEKIRIGRAAALFPAVTATGRPARYVDGPAGARHHLLTARASAQPANRIGPRTVRTTHDRRRVVMRRTNRLRQV